MGKDVLSPWLVYHSTEIVFSLKTGLTRLKEITQTYNVEEVTEWEDQA